VKKWIKAVEIVRMSYAVKVTNATLF